METLQCFATYIQAATGTSIRAPSSGKDVVEAFYAAYNARDIAAINQLIAEDISYHDLVYSEPHEGRKGVMAWLQKVRS
jgi:ketosteroid isomerase-like protein